MVACVHATVDLVQERSQLRRVLGDMKPNRLASSAHGTYSSISMSWWGWETVMGRIQTRPMGGQSAAYSAAIWAITSLAA